MEKVAKLDPNYNRASKKYKHNKLKHKYSFLELF